MANCPRRLAQCRRRGGRFDVVRVAHKLRHGAGGGAVREKTAVRPEREVEDVLATDEAKGLLEAGREAGSLTADAIALALRELDLEPAALDSFYDALEELDIAIVDAAQADADDDH